MADKTKNYGLTKPTTEEFYDINVQNQNMDKIDEQLKKKYDSDNKPTPEDIGAVPSIGVDPDFTTYTDWKSVLDALPHGSVTIVRKPNINNALLPTNCPDSNYGNMIIRRVNAVYQTSSATLYVRKNNLTDVYEATFAQSTASVTWMKVADVDHTHSASDIDSGTLSSDRLPTVPVAKGGTGATSASSARTNLGIKSETWTFTLEDGSTVTKAVYVG